MNIEDIVLSEGHQTALDEICAFVADPEQPVFVLSGYAGTGKSTRDGVLEAGDDQPVGD